MTLADVTGWVKGTVKNIELRDYQAEAWLKLWERRAAHRKRALVHLATGLGKTSVAAVDALHYLKEEKPEGKVLFVSHMNDISEQAKNTFLFVNPQFTTTTFRGKLKDVDVTFSTFQALYSQLDSIDPSHFSYIIWDEAHHIEAETFSAVRKHFTPEFELGLTATPERADGRDIFNYFGHPLFTKSLADGIAEGWLSAVDYHIVFDEAIKEAMGKKFELKTLKEIRELFAIRARNEVIAKEVLDRRHDIGLDKAKTIVFCQNIEAAGQMATLLGGEVYHSDISSDDRLDIMRRFKNGKLQVICTVDMFNEGIDIPDARLVVFLRSTSSRTIFEQQLGRGLRRAPGKDKVTVLDFVANVERINFVRDLGHTISAYRGTGTDYAGYNTSKDAADPTDFKHPFFGISNFDFEDQAIELLERYDTIKGIEYLTTAEVVDAYNKLGTIKQVATHFNVTWNAVWKHLKKAGIDTSGHLAISKSLTNQQVVDKYKELKSIKGVATHFGVDAGTVRNRLKKEGVDIIPTNKTRYASPELIAAFERLGSVRQAAIELGIGRHGARKQLINSGIDTSMKPKETISKEELDEAYKACDADIFKMVEYINHGRSWTDVYKALDQHGYLENKPRPITSAVAAAAYYKFGSTPKAGEYLGVSATIIRKKSKGALYIAKYSQKWRKVAA